MSGLPNTAHLYGLDTKGGEFMAALQAFFELVRQGTGQQDASELTIAAGIVTPTRGEHVVDTEADAASDDLATIATTNFVAGQWLMLGAAHTDRTVVVKHAAGGDGQIHLQGAADFSLDETGKWVLLKRVGADWVEILRNDGLGAVVANDSITDAKLRNSAALSVIGRAANSSGDPADIAAGANDRILRRVSDALDFGQLTAGMVPNGILTYAMLASGALATTGEFYAATASKLLSAAAVWGDIVALTDAATITVDMATGVFFGGASNGPLDLGGDRTLGTPSSTKRQSGLFLFGATGATRTLTLHANYNLATGVEPSPISIDPGELVVMSYFVRTSTDILVPGIFRF